MTILDTLESALQDCDFGAGNKGGAGLFKVIRKKLVKVRDEIQAELEKEAIEHLRIQQETERNYQAELDKHRWIPVSERLPEEHKVVLVAGGVAKFINGDWWSGMEEPLYRRRIEWKVTYWKPIILPDIPAEAELMTEAEFLKKKIGTCECVEEET